MIKYFLHKFILFLKYFNFKFKEEGYNCNYRSLYSKFLFPEKISLGNNVWLGSKTELDGAGEIIIGNGVIFGPEVCIYSRSHNYDSSDLKALPFDNVMLKSMVHIKDYVWIGRRAIVLPGVIIGRGAVVGAGSVVSRNVPDYAVVVGNPARVVKYRNREKFESLLSENIPFIYSKFGHEKF